LSRNTIIFQRASCQDMVSPCQKDLLQRFINNHRGPEASLLFIPSFFGGLSCSFHTSARNKDKARWLPLHFVICGSFLATSLSLSVHPSSIPFNPAPLLFSEQLNGPYTHTCCCLWLPKASTQLKLQLPASDPWPPLNLWII